MAQAQTNNTFYTKDIMDLWDRGYNTNEIARRLSAERGYVITEASVYNIMARLTR